MGFFRIRVLLLGTFLAAVCVSAQTQLTGNADYQAKKQKAVELFAQGKRLEALPLLEELAKANPKDDQVLVALAASLVEHAATLTDQQAAGQERLRARDLLDRAYQLGNTSTLALNLSELLKNMPDSGAIQFSSNPQVEQAMRAGEAAFARRDFDEALKDYGKALELDPRNYMAVLFTGNTYDKQNNYGKGAEWYERAMAIDPNTETAYRYYADMMARIGDMGKARSLLIQAAVAEPYNRIVWRELQAWAMLNKTKINEIYIGVPVPPKDPPKPDAPPTDVSSAWEPYRAAKANWKNGDEFKKHFPGEKEYRHSLAEETEALTAEAKEAEELAADKNTAALVNNDPGLTLLLKLYHAGMIQPYVLFSLGDNGISRDYEAYRAHHRDQLQAYLEKFVVPPLP
jgi:tetratricopeptide (TPR) repeat protein